MNLDSRLFTAASLVRKGKIICDVGTDHAYLPVYLVSNGLSPCAVACDLNEKPLENARRTVEEYGLTDRIKLVLSDGLDSVDANLIEDVIFCGMGGELILKLLLSFQGCRDKERQYILQPMTHASTLRKGLYQNGFEILREVPVIDSVHRYTVMQAAFTGEAKETSLLFQTIGKIPEEKSEAALLFLEREENRIQKIEKGLSTSKERAKQEEAAKWHTILEELHQIIQFKREESQNLFQAD